MSDAVHLRETDVVRTVTFQEDDLDVDSRKEATPCPVLRGGVDASHDQQEHDSIERLKRAMRCPFPGLEFEHQWSETGVTDLHIHITFKKLLGKLSTVRKAQRGGHLTRASAAAVETDTLVQLVMS